MNKAIGAAALAALALAVGASPAAALLETDAAGTRAEVRPDPRDGRRRSVTWEQGAIIRLAVRRGHALMVELDPGQEVQTFLTSDQDVMSAVSLSREDAREADRRDHSRGTGGKDAEEAQPCSLTTNLQVCVRLSRFLAIKPVTCLDPQPLHVIAARLRNGKVEEVPYVFELETVGEECEGENGDNGAAKVAGPGVPPLGFFYSVRVNMPAPAPQAAAAPPRPASVRRSRLALEQPQPPQPAAPVQPPPGANSSYDIQGDRSLLGAPGR